VIKAAAAAAVQLLVQQIAADNWNDNNRRIHASCHCQMQFD